jgi:hypothetical protein
LLLENAAGCQKSSACVTAWPDVSMRSKMHSRKSAYSRTTLATSKLEVQALLAVRAPACAQGDRGPVAPVVAPQCLDDVVEKDGHTIDELGPWYGTGHRHFDDAFSLGTKNLVLVPIEQRAKRPGR